MPKKLLFRSTLFGDGARGYAIQCEENEEFGVTVVAVREDRASPFVETFSSEATGDEEFSSFEALRAAYNALLKK